MRFHLANNLIVYYRREVPERTEGYEGFYHLMNFEGNVEKATLQYIIRDHDKNNLIYVKAFHGNT